VSHLTSEDLVRNLISLGVLNADGRPYPTGGTLGALQYRDTGVLGGISWLSPGAAGTILTGTGAAPAWSATPSFSSFALSAAGGGELLTLRDTAGVAHWSLGATDFEFAGVSDHTYTLGFNLDGAALTHPTWAEAVEPRYHTGAPPNGLLEKLWTYTSIDRGTNFRPFNFSIDLNTHLANMRWEVDEFRVHGVGQTPGSDETLYVDTADKVLSCAGQLHVGALGTPAYRMTITGAPVNGVMLGITGLNVVSGNELLHLATAAAVTGDLDVVNAAPTVSGTLRNLLRNTGAGAAHHFLWAGSGGDAFFRTLANVDWAFGVDRSDAGKWKLCNGDVLGTNDRITVTSAGAVTITALAGVGTRPIGVDANGTLVVL
jgi:hypothetical protein